MKKPVPHPYSPEGLKLIAKISRRAFRKPVKWARKNVYADFPQADK